MFQGARSGPRLGFSRRFNKQHEYWEEMRFKKLALFWGVRTNLSRRQLSRQQLSPELLGSELLGFELLVDDRGRDVHQVPT
jgi:hypothetical protein